MEQFTSRKQPQQSTGRHSGRRVSGYGRRPDAKGKRLQKPTGRGRRRLWQLTISGVLLVMAVVIKLTMPQLTEMYRDRLLGLIGDQTDFVAAFSAIGRTFAEDGEVADALNDAYIAVFGAQEAQSENADHISGDNLTGEMVYHAGNIPENVVLLQEPLGFDYTTPVSGTLTSAFGYRDHPFEGENKFHYGLDLAAEEGTAIVSFADGIVVVVGESSDLGKYVMITHENGYTTLYAHCKRITASSGQTVRAGDPVAEVGQTGLATGNHLHFELHRGDVYLNPIYYV